MWRRTLVLGAMLFAMASLSMAQPVFPGYGSGKGGPRRGHGFFPGFGGWGQSSLMRLPRGTVALHFMNRMVFDDHRETRITSRGLFPYYGYGYGYGGALYERPKLYSSEYFVKQWVSRTPVAENAVQSNLDRSLVLKRGMQEESVVRLLGSPLERIRLEGREIWKYSGYSLVFESGTLIDIR